MSVLTRGLLLYCAHTNTNGKEGWGMGTTRLLEPGAASSFPATFSPKQAAQRVTTDLPKQRTACHATVDCLQSIHSLDPADYARQTRQHLSAKLFYILKATLSKISSFEQVYPFLISFSIWDTPLWRLRSNDGSPDWESMKDSSINISNPPWVYQS